MINSAIAVAVLAPGALSKMEPSKPTQPSESTKLSKFAKTMKFWKKKERVLEKKRTKEMKEISEKSIEDPLEEEKNDLESRAEEAELHLQVKRNKFFEDLINNAGKKKQNKKLSEDGYVFVVQHIERQIFEQNLIEQNLKEFERSPLEDEKNTLSKKSMTELEVELKASRKSLESLKSLKYLSEETIDQEETKQEDEKEESRKEELKKEEEKELKKKEKERKEKRGKNKQLGRLFLEVKSECDKIRKKLEKSLKWEKGQHCPDKERELSKLRKSVKSIWNNHLVKPFLNEFVDKFDQKKWEEWVAEQKKLVAKQKTKNFPKIWMPLVQKFGPMGKVFKVLFQLRNENAFEIKLKLETGTQGGSIAFWNGNCRTIFMNFEKTKRLGGNGGGLLLDNLVFELLNAQNNERFQDAAKIGAICGLKKRGLEYAKVEAETGREHMKLMKGLLDARVAKCHKKFLRVEVNENYPDIGGDWVSIEKNEGEDDFQISDMTVTGITKFFNKTDEEYVKRFVETAHDSESELPHMRLSTALMYAVEALCKKKYQYLKTKLIKLGVSPDTVEADTSKLEELWKIFEDAKMSESPALYVKIMDGIMEKYKNKDYQKDPDYQLGKELEDLLFRKTLAPAQSLELIEKCTPEGDINELLQELTKTE